MKDGVPRCLEYGRWLCLEELRISFARYLVHTMKRYQYLFNCDPVKPLALDVACLGE
jgi:hypothetical protein